MLYHHPAEPSPEVLAHPDNFRMYTAVGQYLALTLMALGSPGERRQEERRCACERLKTWAEDFEATLHSIPKDERWAPDSSPSIQPITYEGVERSPYLLRRRKRRSAANQLCEESLEEDDRQESSDDDSAHRSPGTPTPTGRSMGQGTRRSQRLLAQRPREQDQQYCTQKCLLGLVKGTFLDLTCPNVALHRKKYAHASMRHPVNHGELLRLLWKQLA
ncbi:hypothetical protein CDD83_7015 [Cordyceps sp. RAO-2017]|nr:hypothetical protein CDD83_7015 [Cordyceps sp. RAO-2017]